MGTVTIVITADRGISEGKRMRTAGSSERGISGGENVGIGGNCRRGKYSMSQQDLLIFMKNSEDKKTLRVFLLPDCISIQLLSVH